MSKITRVSHWLNRTRSTVMASYPRFKIQCSNWKHAQVYPILLSKASGILGKVLRSRRSATLPAGVIWKGRVLSRPTREDRAAARPPAREAPVVQMITIPALPFPAFRIAASRACRMFVSWFKSGQCYLIHCSRHAITGPTRSVGGEINGLAARSTRPRSTTGSLPVETPYSTFTATPPPPFTVAAP